MLVSISETDPMDKRVLCRVDFNVPMKNGEIQDDTRIKRSLPTIRHLLDKKAKIVLCSHLGRPKGQIKSELNLRPIAAHLSSLLNVPVEFIEGLVTGETKQKVDQAFQESNVVLLDNTRFNQGETKNQLEFSKLLARLADIFVSDAFGTVHRAHASTVGVTNFLPGYAGLLVGEEYKKITNAMENPQKPSIAIFGGAKISTKLGVVENFLPRVDTIVLGGGMANTFLYASGTSIGKSLFEDEMVKTAQSLLTKAEDMGVTLLLPKDVRIARSIEEPILENGSAKVVSVTDIPHDSMILDIGPTTEADILSEIQNAKTVVWNGPLGVFENELYREGTMTVAKQLIQSNPQTVVGGGETAYAINMLTSNIPDNIHISTGGGASLELLSGLELPGLVCLQGKVITE